VLHRHICVRRAKPLWAVSRLAKASRSANANVFPLIRINDHVVAWLTKFPKLPGKEASALSDSAEFASRGDNLGFYILPTIKELSWGFSCTFTI